MNISFDDVDIIDCISLPSDSEMSFSATHNPASPVSPSNDGMSPQGFPLIVPYDNDLSLTLHSFIPILRHLPGLCLDQTHNSYYIRGSIATDDWARLCDYTQMVSKFIVTDVANEASVSPAAFLRLARLQRPDMPLLPSLSDLVIVDADASIAYLELLLTPSLKSLTASCIPDTQQSIFFSFLTAIEHEAPLLQTLIFGPGRFLSSSLQTIPRFKNLRHLELKNEDSELPFAFFDNIGSLPKLEIFILDARYVSNTVTKNQYNNTDEPPTFGAVNPLLSHSFPDSNSIDRCHAPISTSGTFNQLAKLHVVGWLPLLEDLIPRIMSTRLEDVSVTLIRLSDDEAARQKAEQKMRDEEKRNDEDQKKEEGKAEPEQIGQPNLVVQPIVIERESIFIPLKYHKVKGRRKKAVREWLKTEEEFLEIQRRVVVTQEETEGYLKKQEERFLEEQEKRVRFVKEHGRQNSEVFLKEHEDGFLREHLEEREKFLMEKEGREGFLTREEQERLEQTISMKEQEIQLPTREQVEEREMFMMEQVIREQEEQERILMDQVIREHEERERVLMEQEAEARFIREQGEQGRLLKEEEERERFLVRFLVSLQEQEEPASVAFNVYTVPFTQLLRTLCYRWKTSLKIVSVCQLGESFQGLLNPPILPEEMFRELLFLPAIENLEVRGWTLDSVESIFSVAESVPNLKSLILPIDETNSGISLPTLRRVAESCPRLESFQCRIEPLSLIPVYTVPTNKALSHGLRTLSVGNSSPHPDPKKLPLIARHLYLLFPNLEMINTSEEHNAEQWVIVDELVKMCQTARIDDINRPSAPINQ